MNNFPTGRITLFQETLSCRDCLYSWDGYVHGFARGHTVLTKEKRIIFIPDDLAYCFPDALNYDYIELFKKEEWKDIEACPKCGAKNLFPPVYDQEKTEDVDCIIIGAEDLEESNGVWSISESGLTKLNWSEPAGGING